MGSRQGSQPKNWHRATTMLEKTKRIGQPSNRQGGPYTQEEIDLWQDVKNLGGYKQHISVHTNTKTGRVKVYERDHEGNIAQTLDDSKMENFDELKQAIGEASKK